MPTIFDQILCFFGIHSYSDWKPDPFNAKYEERTCASCGERQRRKVV